MNFKPFLILCLISVLTVGISRANVSDTTFFLHIDREIGFQSQIERQVLLSVSSGAFNCSNASLTMSSTHGKLVFMNNDSVTFTTDFNVSGLQINNVRVASGVSTSQIQNDVTVIEWWITIEPWLPITFIFGSIGLVCMFVAPLYCVHLFKKKEYQWALVQLITVGSIGVGLVLAWLWGS